MWNKLCIRKPSIHPYWKVSDLDMWKTLLRLRIERSAHSSATVLRSPKRPVWTKNAQAYMHSVLDSSTGRNKTLVEDRAGPLPNGRAGRLKIDGKSWTTSSSQPNLVQVRLKKVVSTRLRSNIKDSHYIHLSLAWKLTKERSSSPTHFPNAAQPLWLLHA